jgi:hypothetical protein
VETFFGVDFNDLSKEAKKRVKRDFPLPYRIAGYLVKKGVVKQVTAVRFLKAFIYKTKSNDAIRAHLARQIGVKK